MAKATLKVTRKRTIDATAHTPRTIVFNFTPVAPLYLASLTVKEDTGINATTGLVTPGTNATNNTGYANASEPSGPFQTLWDTTKSCLSITITISYDDVTYVIGDDLGTEGSYLVLDADWLGSLSDKLAELDIPALFQGIANIEHAALALAASTQAWQQNIIRAAAVLAPPAPLGGNGRNATPGAAE